MTQNIFFKILAFALISSLFLNNCTKDQLPEPPEPEDCDALMPTYTTTIKTIIDNSCAYAGCHLNVAPGNYTTYQGLVGNLNSGKFKEKVVALRADPDLGMPPDNVPVGRPKDLTEEELNLINCWLDAGFPEN